MDEATETGGCSETKNYGTTSMMIILIFMGFKSIYLNSMDSFGLGSNKESSSLSRIHHWFPDQLHVQNLCCKLMLAHGGKLY